MVDKVNHNLGVKTNMYWKRGSEYGIGKTGRGKQTPAATMLSLEGDGEDDSRLCSSRHIRRIASRFLNESFSNQADYSFIASQRI